MLASPNNSRYKRILSSEYGEMLAKKPRIIVFLVVCLILVYGMYVARQFNGFDFARYDPGWMVSTVMSLVEDGDLDLRNQLHNDPAQAADQTSLGENGQWYPLHEFLMPVLTVPFYLAFGIYGCLIFNVLVSILLMLTLFELCCRHVDFQSAFAAIILTAFTTLFLNYTYSYSLDVFSTFLLVLAYWCVVRRRFLPAGFVWGMATLSRLSIAITLPGFIAYLLLVADFSFKSNSKGRTPGIQTLSKKMRPAVSFLTGGFPLAICFLLSNWLMFGSPATTSYDRWQQFVNGQSVVSSQRGAFSCSFVENLPKTLIDQKSGLLIGAPLIIVSVAFGLGPFWRKARNETILLLITSGSLIVLFSKYCYAVPGGVGNRYLMPVVALFAIPLGLAIANCFHGRTGHSIQTDL
jgi:hypothetical protein